MHVLYSCMINMTAPPPPQEICMLWRKWLIAKPLHSVTKDPTWVYDICIRGNEAKFQAPYPIHIACSSIKKITTINPWRHQINYKQLKSMPDFGEGRSFAITLTVGLIYLYLEDLRPFGS